MSDRGVIILLAWPETAVRQVGMWYDTLMKWTGINRHGYYQAGHAALVILKSDGEGMEYFDFGRYHTPVKKGRVRDRKTDPNLSLKVKPMMGKDGRLSNLEEILNELSGIKTTYGTGTLWASVAYGINYKKSYMFAKKLQQMEAIDYGPFDLSGNNCSRFVAKVARSAIKSVPRKILLSLPYTITPTPLSNVRLGTNDEIIYKYTGGKLTALPKFTLTGWRLRLSDYLRAFLKKPTMEQSWN